MITSASKLKKITPPGAILFVTKIADTYKLHICSSTGIQPNFISPSLYKKLALAGALSNAGMERISNIKLDEIAQE